MVNWGSGEVGEDNRSESPGVVRRGAMALHWPSNRVYLFPVTSGVLRPERIWYALPNWQWAVPTRHVIEGEFKTTLFTESSRNWLFLQVYLYPSSPALPY